VPLPISQSSTDSLYSNRTVSDSFVLHTMWYCVVIYSSMY